MIQQNIQPRGGMEHDWKHWSLVYQRRMRKLKKLICAEGYIIRSGEDGMPIELVRVDGEEQKR